MHYGPMSDLQRSPFFTDVLLSVGGWSFHIWKEKITVGPLLSSPNSNSYLICGRWSPTRPGVFYISKADGTIEVWDLVDRSHVASCVQNVSSIAISSMSIHHYGKFHTYHQFIAAGDDQGTLHILEVPRNLIRQTKNEKSIVRTFFDREVRRLNYVTSRKQQRARDRPRFEAAILEALAATNKANEINEKEKNATNLSNENIAQNQQESGGPPGSAGKVSSGTMNNTSSALDKEEEEYLKLEREVLLATGTLILEIPENA
ncbi:WD repeat-containing protein 63 [Nowakowskiella sp. JEL0078]|nr:WD repeat-containing protein 63 [Nowakowskiella sp. JEL0078]